MPPHLRIIDDAPRPAAWNMAADLLLLERAGASPVVTLRLYRWSPPAVSLGWMQRAADTLDLAALSAAGIQWVRRPTGGRAVLHQDDLTYSVVFGRRCAAMGSTVRESYHVISRCLLAGLAKAGVRAATHDSGLDTARARRETRLPCFLAPNRDEIMVNGRKLAGSAQKRVADAVLQHGSIPLGPAFRDLPRYSLADAGERSEHTRLLARKCVCACEVQPSLTAGRLADCLAAGFGRELGAAAESLPWSASELQTIDSRTRDAQFVRTYLAA